MDAIDQARRAKKHADDAIPQVPDINPPGGGGRLTGCWWGQIITFNATTGLGTAKKATGTYPSFGAGTGNALDVIIGVGAMHYCPETETRYGHFLPSGPGVTPAYTLNHHIRVPYTEPTAGELHDEQDDGGGTASCGS